VAKYCSFLIHAKRPTTSDVQDARLAEPVKVSKQRTRYTPIGRKPPGPKGWAKKRADLRPAEAAAHAAE